MENNHNNLDDFLKRGLSGKGSPLPDGMLARILEEQKRKKRVIFWWVNTAILSTIAIVGFLLFNWLGPAESPESPKTSKVEKNNNNSAKDNTQNPTQTESDKSQLPQLPEQQNADKSGEHSKDVNSNSGQVGNVVQDSSTKDDGHVSVDNGKNNTPVQSPIINDSVPGKNTGNRDSETGKTANNAKPENPAETKPEPDKVVGNSVAANNTNDSFSDDRAFVPASAKKKKPGNHNDPGKMKPEGFVSLGWFQDMQSLKIAEQDPMHVHRDFTALTKSAVQPLTGSVFSCGIQGLVRPWLRVQAGIQFAQASNNLKYSYKQTSQLVFDSGRIVNYLPISDSAQQTFTVNQSYLVRSFAIPIQFGYSQNLGNKFELTGFVGLAPQWRFQSHWLIPDKLEIPAMHEVNVPVHFTIPVTLGLGIYRKEENYTFGIQGRIAPLLSHPIGFANDLQLSYRRTEVSFIVGFKIGK